MRISIGLDPDIAHFGVFVLSWHGLSIFVAVVVAIALAVRWARPRGLPEEWVYNVALWGIVGGIVGARVFTLIDTFDYYAQNPWAFFAIWQGGLAIYGAILGGFAGGALYARIKGYPIGQLADLAAPALLIAQAIGRLGDIVNGDAHGTPTSFPFSLVYTHPNSFAPLGVPTHATPVYEILWDLVALGAVLKLRDRLQPSGALFAAYLATYSFGRFFISFLRGNIPVLAGLNAAQLIALGLLALTVPFLAYRARLVSPPVPVPYVAPASEKALPPASGDDGQSGGAV
ncbi:MAG: prolipoprotein diacylglyceryl transferase [Chloroflexi bacterium]|nr:prolipoprotein diacylglyceryl transferase [Chloroflexota bacterium]